MRDGVRWITVAALALAAGALLYGVQRDRRLEKEMGALAADFRALRAQSPAAQQQPWPATAPIDRRQIEQVAEAVAARMAAEAAKERPATASAPAQPRDEAPPREPTAPELAAANEATRIVDEALARRTLHREDVLELRRLSDKVDVAAMRELRRRIAVALNRDELRPTDPTLGLP
jgi:uncharacterized membrane protein